MTWWKKLLMIPPIALAVVVAVPLGIIAVTCWLIGSIAVVLLVSLLWIPRGKRFLVVYSDSAQWKPYFEDDVVPAFGTSAQVINLSRDGGAKKWWHLDWAVYRHCGGYRNCFPAVF